MGKITIIFLAICFVALQLEARRHRGKCRLTNCRNQRSPVCGDDGRTYRSLCHLVKALCYQNRPVFLRVKYRGFCKRSFVCSLPRQRGPCYSIKKRYYFNKHKKRCLPFWFGGCRGNRNNFPTYRKCKSFCGRYGKLDELDDFEDQIDRIGGKRSEMKENDADQDYERGTVEGEGFVDKIRGELERDDGQNEDDDERYEDDREGEDDENEQRDEKGYSMDEDNGEENSLDGLGNDDGDDDDKDIAFENEIEYFSKAKTERKQIEDKQSNVVERNSKNTLMSAPKSTYASCIGGMCELNLTPVGCFKDNHNKLRPLPVLVDSHRDSTSHAFHGVSIDWKKFETTIRQLACDCVKLARQQNYTHIGLQHYGECWAGNASTYAIDGTSDQCVNGSYKTCEKGKFCIGKEKTNYVYKIEPEVPLCEVGYEKVGCFHDPVNVDKRPMPELLDSHRDRTSNAYHGLELDWKDYKRSLKILIDHCAKRTKAKGYNYFGIQQYGECWSGRQAEETYSKFGNSTSCINADFEICDPKYACQCAGKENANYVYRLI